jgi:TRAP transporter TAXI family solute receptor
MRTRFLIALGAAIALLTTGGLASSAFAQQDLIPAPRKTSRAVPRTPATPAPIAPANAHATLTDRLNQNTVTVISGNPNGTYLFFAYDMSAVLDNGDELRVLPVVGKGAFQNVKDILHLRGVDLGITQSDIMSYLKKTGEFGANIDERMAYLAKLYNEELHILAGPGINSIADLNGKKVNLSDAGSGTQFSTRLIFQHLGVKVDEVNMGQGDGYLKVKSGEIAATVLIGGKPTAAYAKFKLEPGMKLLPVPYAEALEADYFPAKLTNDDYPDLIPPGQSVDTVAVGAILAVYNWPRNTERYRRVAKFTDVFLDKFPEFLKPPRHVKWREANLNASLKAWRRFPAAQEWVDRNRPTAETTASTTARIDTDLARDQAQRAAPNDKIEQERLFQRFLEWSKQQKR